MSHHQVSHTPQVSRPLPNFVHAASRLVTVRVGLWGRNLLHPFTIVKAAAASSLNSPCPPPRTRSASSPGGNHITLRAGPARDFAASDHVRRIGNPGALYPFLATFRCLSLVLSPPALTPAVRGGVVAILSDNSRHPSHSPPVSSVRQWWVLPPAGYGPCCWQTAHNPGSFLVFNRTPVGKRQSSTPELVVFQQGQSLRVSVSETGRSIRCRQAVAEAS